MGGGAYLTNRNINNNLALKNQQEQEVDPVAAAIRNVSTPVSTVTPMAVTPKVDSLDQAITPIASNRTTTQLFPDYAPATPEVAIAAPVTGPTPAPTERVPTTASTSGLSVQDFGAQPTFGSPDEALANYGNVFNTLKGQEEQVNKVYNYNNFDPGDFGRTSVSLREGNRAAGTGLAEYVQQNEIPLSKVIDGERKYLTTGNAQANQELWPNAFKVVIL